MDKKKIWESYRFPLILLGGIILGAILGAILGEKATVLAPIGNVFINLLFMVVVPMVFVSIVNAHQLQTPLLRGPAVNWEKWQVLVI